MGYLTGGNRQGRKRLRISILSEFLNGFRGGPLIQPGQQFQMFDSVFEEQVEEALRNKGLVLDTQVGASGYRIDLAVRHPERPDRYILGIECDGATYHSARSVRERDVYRQRFLESRGWKIHRIWSRNWWRNREREIEKVLNLVDELSYCVTQA